MDEAKQAADGLTMVTKQLLDTRLCIILFLNNHEEARRRERRPPPLLAVLLPPPPRCMGEEECLGWRERAGTRGAPTPCNTQENGSVWKLRPLRLSDTHTVGHRVESSVAWPTRATTSLFCFLRLNSVWFFVTRPPLCPS